MCIVFCTGVWGGGAAGVGRRNNLRLQESPPKTLTVEVVSSQTRVAVTVDGATVSCIASPIVEAIIR